MTSEQAKEIIKKLEAARDKTIEECSKEPVTISCRTVSSVSTIAYNYAIGVIKEVMGDEG